MSALITAPIARLDYRLRVSAALLRGARRTEHFAVAGMALASAAAALPFGGALYPVVAIPALLALAGLIRHVLDGLDARRDALTAAGANPADSLFIQVAGPLGATFAGAIAGIGAGAVLGRLSAHALVPLAVGLAAAFLIRRAWIGAPALAVGSLAAVVTAVAAQVTASAPAPPAQTRSRPVIADLAAAHVPYATTAPSAWSAAWPTALAAVLALAVVQLLIARRERLRELLRALTAAVTRLLTARGGA